MTSRRELNREFYASKVWSTLEYQGRRILKYPTDLAIFAEIIEQSEPEVIVETGSAEGGSAAWFAQYAEVISVDIVGVEPLVGVTFLRGDSLGMAGQIAELVNGRSCLVTLDSNHSALHVQEELRYYAPLATQWLVVEDTAVDAYDLDPGNYPLGGPGIAVQRWLPDHREWRQVRSKERLMLGMNPGGWLRRMP